MLFVEIRFIFFFLVVFVLCWSTRSNRARKLILLGASYVFYAAWDWRLLGLILFSTLTDYVVALRVERARTHRRRKGWLMVSLGVNLGLLGFFKYFNFFVESGAELLRVLGIGASPNTLDIILPVGISFYTFQTLSYTIDVYRERIPATRSFLDIALFVGFFPQLVAGPIVRAAHFLPQLSTTRLFERVDVRACLLLFLVGFVKKSCVSDNLAPVVDAYFTSPGDYTAASAWIAVLFYAVQIYCDFSGYSDMAIACAGLLGYRLPLNFAAPYLAPNIAEFWRRWHISLSSWLRDYLFIPLGGSRGSTWQTGRNLLVTMFLGGLWHGAAWTFVIRGVTHGAFLVLRQSWRSVLSNPSSKRPTLYGRILGTPVTFCAVCLAWAVFRANDTSQAWTVLRSLLLWPEMQAHLEFPGYFWYGFLALATAHVVAQLKLHEDASQRLPGWCFAAAYGVAVGLALSFASVEYVPFIYFQF